MNENGPVTAAVSPRHVSQPATDLRVATYNIHSGVGLDRRHDPERIIRVIDELDADIVGLQEVVSSLGSDADSMGQMADARCYETVTGPNIVHNRGRYGNLLLTRRPVLDFRLHDLTVAPHEPRGAIDACIEMPEGPMQVIVTHLGLRRAERRRQLARLHTAVNNEATACVILGDFNAPTGLELRRAGLGGHGTLRFAPRSFPANMPLLALDRIWVQPDALIRSMRAHRSPLARLASDHLPVIATLTLPAAGGVR